MKKLYVFLSLFLLFASCDQEKAQTSQEIGAKELVLKSIDQYNTDLFFNSTITFNMNDLNYTLYRKDNIQDFQVLREHDSVIYKATYNNGHTTYTIDDELQPESSLSRQFNQVKLEGLAYLFSIPHVFNQNAVRFKRLDNTLIKDVNYHTIHISYFKASDEDPDDEFILYINPETFLVDYYAENYSMTAGERTTFNVAHNSRTINGITFADYYVLSQKARNQKEADIPRVELSKLYELYLAVDLDELNPLIFENIVVKPNK